jgi:multidrug efflux pump subunit AcrB
MFSHFFIRRPIFAAVLSIVIFLAGAVAAVNLPVAQYPQITPPSIIVMCNYPGADARVVAESVAAPIEQQVNGVEDMLYMVSQSNNDGSYQLTVTFKPGVNLNFAQVLVQNRINLALPLLPDVVKQAGVTTRKRSPDILLVVAIYSKNKDYDQVYLSNFATIKVKDELARIEGTGDVIQFGQQDYSMRLWVDPERLSALNLTAYDVTNAIRAENFQFAAGHFGQPPTQTSTLFEFPITTVGRLTDPSQFEEIVIRSDSEGRKVRIKDIGHAVLGARNQDSTSKVNGRPNGSIAIFALPDANAIATADRVKAKMVELKKTFPKDLDYVISLDMTPFIEESIKEVFRTLIEAVILVALVVLVFLQNWRSAIIPLVAVPVAIVGTFAVMAAIGFSLNNLTLFGLVLAIGIVVDDAIVVVEAVEHHIEQGMTPHQAAHQAMNEVSGPVVAVALVLSAVFIPCAFITGITGQFFKQFALTIAVSTVLSAFNSLTLSPALAAILLQPRGAKKDLVGRVLDFAFGWFFWLFNRAFHYTRAAYIWLVGVSLTGRAPFPVLLAGLVGGWIGWQLPVLFAGVVVGWIGWQLPLVGVGLDRLGLLEPLHEFLLHRSWVHSELRLAPLREFLLDQSWVLSELRMICGIAGALVLAGLIHWGLKHWIAPNRRLLNLRLAGSVVVLLAYGGLLADTLYGFRQLPTGYIPNQDQGRFYIAIQLPDATSLDQTQKAVDHIREVVQNVPGVQVTTAIAGQSFTFNANGSNFGQFFISFQGFDKRHELERRLYLTEDSFRLLSTKIPDQVQVLAKLKENELSKVQEKKDQGFESLRELRDTLTEILDEAGIDDKRRPEIQREVQEAAVHLDLSSTAIVERVQKLLDEQVPEARVSLFTPPPVPGLGSASGFKIIIEDRGDLGIAELQKQVERVMAAGNSGHYKLTEKSLAALRDDKNAPSEDAIAALSQLKDQDYLTRDLFMGALDDALSKANLPNKSAIEQARDLALKHAENRKVVGHLFSVFRANVPQLFVDLNRDQCQTMGVNPRDVFSTLQIYLGSFYVNDFNEFGRTWQVITQASGQFRNDPSKIKLLKVRNSQGDMVPLGAVLSVREVGGPINIGRYNMYTAAAILGSTESGISSGQGIEEMERICHEVLSPGMAFEWTEINYMEVDAAKNIWNQLIFPLAVVFVFLVLAAQYESWALPLAVILVVPMCILGSLTGVSVSHDDINIFTQIGFVVLVGLASKNAILIVEFAKHKREAGLSRHEATLQACQLRLRPILMTSFAFILGVVPLLVSTGAGFEMRKKLGTAVFSGMLGVTLFGIFLTPVFFNVVEWLIDVWQTRKKARRKGDGETGTEGPVLI